MRHHILKNIGLALLGVLGVFVAGPFVLALFVIAFELWIVLFTWFSETYL